MLFNSVEFVLVFLPITLAGFFILGRFGLKRLALAWLVLASMVFYGYFRVDYLLLLAVLVVFNFWFGRVLAADYRAGQKRRWKLAVGVIVNLGVLGYFKYTNFLLSNVDVLLGTDWVIQNVALPIGISFFTFQKIAYLVDSYNGQTDRHDFLDFALFVSYFPQLIAGPIVHHKEMMPQFHRDEIFKPSAVNLAAGLALFAIGLFKKIVIADNVAEWADAYFLIANAGTAMSFLEAWVAALSFTFQIYFDFSGYTDMALGLALMIGIRLPMNFNSPYKATNIIDFWRRWHMTLSRFLRDYVYIGLGGNRKGRVRRYVNLMLTMLIGGLWHGAAWTFVVWGGLHGFYLVINHAWNYVKDRMGWSEQETWWGRWAGRILTFLAVVVAWVFFRAQSFDAATTVLTGMAGLNGLGFGAATPAAVTTLIDQGFMLAVLIAAVWTLPNSMQLLASVQPVIGKIDPARIARPILAIFQRVHILGSDGTLSLGAVTGVLVGILVVGCLLYQAITATSLQSFIYFQF